MNVSSAFCWEIHFRREGTISLLLSRCLALTSLSKRWLGETRAEYGMPDPVSKHCLPSFSDAWQSSFLVLFFCAFWEFLCFSYNTWYSVFLAYCLLIMLHRASSYVAWAFFLSIKLFLNQKHNLYDFYWSLKWDFSWVVSKNDKVISVSSCMILKFKKFHFI